MPKTVLIHIEVQHLPAWEWCDASGVFLEFEDQEKALGDGCVPWCLVTAACSTDMH